MEPIVTEPFKFTFVKTTKMEETSKCTLYLHIGNRLEEIFFPSPQLPNNYFE